MRNRREDSFYITNRMSCTLEDCLAIGTTVEEVQYLLKYAGQAPLYVRRKRDVVIWFGFLKHMSLSEVNEKLYERGFRMVTRMP